MSLFHFYYITICRVRVKTINCIEHRFGVFVLDFRWQVRFASIFQNVIHQSHPRTAINIFKLNINFTPFLCCCCSFLVFNLRIPFYGLRKWSEIKSKIQTTARDSISFKLYQMKWMKDVSNAYIISMNQQIAFFLASFKKSAHDFRLFFNISFSFSFTRQNLNRNIETAINFSSFFSRASKSIDWPHWASIKCDYTLFIAVVWPFYFLKFGWSVRFLILSVVLPTASMRIVQILFAACGKAQKQSTQWNEKSLMLKYQIFDTHSSSLQHTPPIQRCIDF